MDDTTYFPSRDTPTPTNDLGRVPVSSTPSQSSSPSLHPPIDRHETCTIGDNKENREMTVKGVSHKERRLRDKLPLQPTLILENSGSVARDHLASERTFLAYVRTSLTIASTGVGLVQLFTISAATTNKSIERYSRPLGSIVIIIGLLTLFFGLFRYFSIQSALVGGKFPVAKISATMLALVLGAVVVTVFGILLGVRSFPQ